MKTALALVLALAAGRTASATPGPADDRLLQTPTDWITRNAISISDLQSIEDAGIYRITDLRVEAVSPLTVSAVLVRNAGAYAVTGEFLYHGMAIDTALDTFIGNGKRPIALQPYVYNGQIKIAGVTVPNTGADHRNWGFLYGTQSYIMANLPAGYRPMTIATYVDPNAGDRRYCVVFVENTEHYTWSWHFRVHAADLDTLAGANSSLIDASADDNTNMDLNVIYYAQLPTPHGVIEGAPYFDTDRSQLISDLRTYDERPLFLTHYTLHGTGTADGETEWFASEVDNY